MSPAGVAKALMMKHKITPNGIPNDSIAAQSALGGPLQGGLLHGDFGQGGTCCLD